MFHVVALVERVNRGSTIERVRVDGCNAVELALTRADHIVCECQSIDALLSSGLIERLAVFNNLFWSAKKIFEQLFFYTSFVIAAVVGLCPRDIATSIEFD